MSQYVATSGAFTSPLAKVNQQLAKAGIKPSTSTAALTTASQESFVSKYKWPILGVVGAAAAIFIIKRRRRRAAAGAK
jgi:hypothetical protein